MSEVERYVDKAMYPAEPMKVKEPTAHLLWMTPDPLGAVASAVRMYKGSGTTDLSQVTDEERRDSWEQVQKTRLTAPLEFVKLHFFLDGVDRAFTHQLVRQRTAVYAQESLRFAVKDGNLAEETSRPPSLDDPTLSHSQRNDRADIWFQTLDAIERGYKALIADGMPAEDARGLLPQAVLTRLNYATDLRNLSEHAGNRLCTQAQFHWRQAFLSIREAIRLYQPESIVDEDTYGRVGWQFELIADSNLFAPVCYQIGKCGFKAEFDRGCTIRSRVDIFEQAGVPSVKWEWKSNGANRINPMEWAGDPKAGWVK